MSQSVEEQLQQVEIALGIVESVIFKRNGGDWKQKTEQRGREHAARLAAKLEPEILDLAKSEPEAKPKKAEA